MDGKKVIINYLLFASYFQNPFLNESVFFNHNVETNRARNVRFGLKHSALKILLRHRRLLKDLAMFDTFKLL